MWHASAWSQKKSDPGRPVRGDYRSLAAPRRLAIRLGGLAAEEVLCGREHLSPAAVRDRLRVHRHPQFEEGYDIALSIANSHALELAMLAKCLLERETLEFEDHRRDRFR